MATNSIADIVEKMKEGSITWGWGAVCVFNRERLNRVLQQQWLDKYDGSNYLPTFSGTMDLNTPATEYGVMKNILLGKPLLSFEPARLDTSRAKLTLSILGGNFSVHDKTVGLLYEFDITEAHGYTLTVELDLSLVVGVVDRLGRVTLDLSKGTRFSCNLVGPRDSQAKLGEYFDQRFKALPPEKQVYVLGILNLKGGSDLTPTNFIVLTQRAPGAAVAGAKNAADGAVVVMVKLRGSAHGGDIPSPERFPYLIPDDSDQDYSATIVLAQEYVDRSDDDKLELIHSLLFPGQKNTFVEHTRREPADLVIFGSLAPSSTSLIIEPGVHVMKAGGEPVEFKAYLNGVAMDVSWSVRSLNSNTSAGSINPTSGLYQPVAAADLGRELVRNIVTASYVDPQTKLKHKVQALLLVTTQSMTISPGVVARIEGETNTVTFVATALKGATLTWKQPTYGRLSATGNTAIYTPPSAAVLLALPEFTVVDTITVEDDTGETVEAAVVLTRAAPTLEIEPRYSVNVGRSATVTLTEKSGAPATIERTWRVIGDGTVSNDGVYTAPATPRRPYDIVRCEISASGMLVYAGYSIIKLASHIEEARWSGLTSFKLVSLRSDQLFANGFQQVSLQAVIQTIGDARLTQAEEDSLRMVYVGSNQLVPEVPALQEGIEDEGSPEAERRWAQTRDFNRFKPYPGSAPRETQPEPDDRASLPSRVDVFMVTRATKATQFYALFEDELGHPWRSDVEPTPGNPDGIIQFTPVPPPSPHIDHYKLTRQRIDGGGGSDPDSDYDFDWYLKTTDYWALTYLREGQVGVDFLRAEVRGLRSIVQWESPAPNETMFSYTGYGYNDPLKPSDGNIMRYETLLVQNLGLPVQTEMKPGHSLAEGKFRIGLFRCEHSDGIRQDQREKLYPLRNKKINVYLTDDEGNKHSLAIGFPASDRNRLYVDHFDDSEQM
ncbi:hypothetical protein [Pseudomonas fluorescens]|uniref:hypothetical protein n=1 Tax=Pseudomonas fluorescens TaxID=294 RepID=UPI0027852358|nr:hypothetical protein [Pseudomonas fluorescens]MDP9784029.1 hypothetical protein [Pseudomonas fluorescens]